MVAAPLHGAAGPWAVPAAAWRSAATLEQERSRWLLWLPVALATGIAAVFQPACRAAGWCGWLAAPRPCCWPPLQGGAAVRGRREALLLALAAACLGFALAQPDCMPWRHRSSRATGRLRGRGTGASTWRRCPRAIGSLLATVTLPGLAPEATPATDPGQSAPRARRPGARRPRPAARAAAATAAAAPAGRVRLRAPGLVRAAGCHRLRARAGRAPRRRPQRAGRWRSPRCAPRSPPASPSISPGSAGAMAAALIAGVRAGHRPGDLAGPADLRIGPHPLGVRAAHGPGRRRRVRGLPLAAGAVPAAGAAVPGAEDRGRRRHRGRRLLPRPLGCQRADPALVPDDRGGPARGHRRPQPVLAAAARLVGTGRAGAAARERARRLVPALVRGRAGADGGLRGLARLEQADDERPSRGCWRRSGAICWASP